MKVAEIYWVGKQWRFKLYEDGNYIDDWLVDSFHLDTEDKE